VFIPCVCQLLFLTCKAKDVIVTKRLQPKVKVPKETLIFGKETSDHMLCILWDKEKGWDKPHIKPYGSIEIDPAASVLHYALACFEGMKAYKDQQGRIRLFRPMENMHRLQTSCASLQFPSFDEEQLLSLIKELLKIDRDWIPEGDGYSLYIRPNVFSTTPVLGVAPATHVLLNVIMSPVGPYFKEGFKPVKLFADTTHVRSWPGGSGAFKLASNYAPTIQPQTLAAQKGYNQIMWLLEGKITEVGTMNLLCLWRNDKGELELITAPLDGCILPGVTRLSILQLCREWNEFRVTEKDWTIQELIIALKENRVVELFGAGTAAVVSPVKGFEYDGLYYDVPCVENSSSLFKRLWEHMNGIFYGKIPSPWSVIVE